MLRVSQQEKDQLIRKWKKSDLNQKEFAAQNGIKYATFHSWIKKHKQEQDDPAFIPVNVKETPAPASQQTEVVFPGGVKVAFNYQPEVEYLQRLAKLR